MMILTIIIKTKEKRSISERYIILEEEEEYFVTAILMVSETNWLVVDLMRTDEMQKVDGEMFMIAGMILISKIGFTQPMKISTSF